MKDDVWGAATSGTCKKCQRFTWISTQDRLCTEPPNKCHFKEKTYEALLPTEDPDLGSLASKKVVAGRKRG